MNLKYLRSLNFLKKLIIINCPSRLTYTARHRLSERIFKHNGFTPTLFQIMQHDLSIIWVEFELSNTNLDFTGTPVFKSELVNEFVDSFAFEKCNSILFVDKLYRRILQYWSIEFEFERTHVSWIASRNGSEKHVLIWKMYKCKIRILNIGSFK